MSYAITRGGTGRYGSEFDEAATNLVTICKQALIAALQQLLLLLPSHPPPPSPLCCFLCFVFFTIGISFKPKFGYPRQRDELLGRTRDGCTALHARGVTVTRHFAANRSRLQHASIHIWTISHYCSCYRLLLASRLIFMRSCTSHLARLQDITIVASSGTSMWFYGSKTRDQHCLPVQLAH